MIATDADEGPLAKLKDFDKDTCHVINFREATRWRLDFDLHPLLANNASAILVRIWASDNACKSLVVMHTNKTPVRIPTTCGVVDPLMHYKQCNFMAQEHIDARNTCAYSCVCATTCEALQIRLISDQESTYEICELEWTKQIIVN